MSKLIIMANTLREMDSLITSMRYEIDTLRFIVARYNKMHGNSIDGSSMTLSPNINFHVKHERISDQHDGIVSTCVMVDHDKLGFESRYQRILKQLDEL